MLYSYFDDIFTQLGNEYLQSGADFYIEKPAIRQQKIDEKVAGIIAALDGEGVSAAPVTTAQ